MLIVDSEINLCVVAKEFTEDTMLAHGLFVSDVRTRFHFITSARNGHGNAHATTGPEAGVDGVYTGKDATSRLPPSSLLSLSFSHYM